MDALHRANCAALLPPAGAAMCCRHDRRFFLRKARRHSRLPASGFGCMARPHARPSRLIAEDLPEVLPAVFRPSLRRVRDRFIEAMSSLRRESGRIRSTNPLDAILPTGPAVAPPVQWPSIPSASARQFRPQNAICRWSRRARPPAYPARNGFQPSSSRSSRPEMMAVE